MKRFAIVGAGARAYEMFAKPIYQDFKEDAQLCGVFDVNSIRAKYISENCGGVRCFDNFDSMLDETKPDCVIIATIDSTHHEYVIRSLEKGYDVIVEKPMTIDAEKCKAIIETEKKTGKKVIVTFNARFQPIFSKIKELIMSNEIGDPLSVSMEWMLDTKHGADYFRRWHRNINNSGGLLVHKATHHFDAINWCIGDSPKTVSAFGYTHFYGSTRDKTGTRCLTCTYKKYCEFYFDINEDKQLQQLYLNAEKEDGYIRDGCVFANEINIYDTMAVNVEYQKGTTLAYSLIAYSPYEGWKMSVTGTNGRLEAESFLSGYRKDEPFEKVRIYNHNGDVTHYDVKKHEGVHGGSDLLLRRMLFVGDVDDELGRMAGSYDGAKSLLIGACANVSIKNKQVVSIEDVLSKF